MIGYCIGRILLTEAALLLLPVPVALLCGESPLPYLWAAAAALAAGILCLLGIWTETGLLLAGAFLTLWLLGSGAAVAAMNNRQIISILKAAE